MALRRTAVVVGLLLPGSAVPVPAQRAPAQRAPAQRAPAQRAPAQGWNDARTLSLVTRASELRARQLADTGLTDYTAAAHGYLTFLAQVGEGFPDPPKVVKADELALEVYWRAPNHSKQLIVGRRDTLLLPTDIQYHRDHLGIVQNNFPSIIRLGEGDEVRDVVHPLSAGGLTAYDFSVRDSLRISIPGRDIDVYEVRFRPRDDARAAAAGALYLARDDAQVVRMAFSFTRAALIDPALEDVAIVLDNALIDGRFWLPRRQEIEIRRSGTWLELPARGIIRGRWEICCYEVNQGVSPALFTGPEIAMAPINRQMEHRFEGVILDALPPEVQAATAEEIRRVQADVRGLVRPEALLRPNRTALLAGGASELVRFTRVEGLAVGLGVRQRLGARFDLMASARYGFSDHEAKGSLSLGWLMPAGGGLRLRLFDEYRDLRDEPETSGLRNSIAAQEFGSDYTDPADVVGAALALERTPPGGLRWRLEAAWERFTPARVTATPSHGVFEPVPPVDPADGPRLSLQVTRPPAPWLGGRASLRAELRGGYLTSDAAARSDALRLAGTFSWTRALGTGALTWRSHGGIAWADGEIPVPYLVFAGGPSSGPGYDAHRFVAARLFSQRLEWSVPVPFPAVPLGRWGRIPGQASIVPLVHGVYVDRSAAFQPTEAGWYPAVGVGLTLFFDLLRFEAARGLRDGRWTFGVDLSRDFWGIL